MADLFAQGYATSGDAPIQEQRQSSVVISLLNDEIFKTKPTSRLHMLECVQRALNKDIDLVELYQIIEAVISGDWHNREEHLDPEGNHLTLHLRNTTGKIALSSHVYDRTEGSLMNTWESIPMNAIANLQKHTRYYRVGQPTHDFSLIDGTGNTCNSGIENSKPYHAMVATQHPYQQQKPFKPLQQEKTRNLKGNWRERPDETTHQRQTPGQTGRSPLKAITSKVINKSVRHTYGSQQLHHMSGSRSRGQLHGNANPGSPSFPTSDSENTPPSSPDVDIWGVGPY